MNNPFSKTFDFSILRGVALTGLGAALMLASSRAEAAASLVTIGNIQAHGYNGTGTGATGKLSQFISGMVSPTPGEISGLTPVDPNDVSTWTHDKSWQEGWQTGNLAVTGSSTNRGWVVLDFSTTQGDLDRLYLWNVKEAGAGTSPQTRGVQTFNLWYTDAPITTVPGSGYYNFTTAGWTQLGGLNTLTIGGGSALNGSYDLSGIPTARYLAIEIISNYGSDGSGSPDTGTNNTVGLAEIVVTSIPEPGSAMFGGVAALSFLRRRREK